MEPETAAPPTQEERTMAMLAHVLQLVTWFIGPLIIYLTKRESKFVAFHALQALIWQAVWFLVSGVMMVAWFVTIFSTIATQRGSKNPDGMPTHFFIVFPIFWLVFMGGWATTMTLGIVYCIKASRGEWAGYPIIERWARRWAGV